MKRVFLPSNGIDFLQDKTHYNTWIRREIEEGYLLIDDTQNRTMRLLLTRANRKNKNATPELQYRYKGQPHEHQNRYDLRMYQAKELMESSPTKGWYTEYESFYHHNPANSLTNVPRAFTVIVRVFDCGITTITVRWMGDAKYFPTPPDYCGVEVTDDDNFTNLGIIRRH